MKRKQADSDRIDDLILGILRENSRISNTDVATKLSLSESAV
ncbi:MAG: AsnC family transcriptional regulator, partial [Thaumarchaeota archaeon]|nr:AsnC family transcriptional regulator [Nitrososphaerota archaeon]